MKIAASDYDGTLFRDKTISKKTIEGVHAWRLAGNKFGPVSGRDYAMLVPQLKHYGVEYDFVICNNGGIIRDGNENVIYQANIDSQVLKSISQNEFVRRSFHFAFSAKDTTYLCHEGEGSWIVREAKEWNLQMTKIAESDIENLQGIHQFSLGFTTPELSRECAEILNKKFGDKIRAYPNIGSVDITPPEISKKFGIEKLLESMEQKNAEIFVIGDEINDLPMIQAFNGYSVDTAREEIKSQAKQVFDDVGSMLKFFL